MFIQDLCWKYLIFAVVAELGGRSADKQRAVKSFNELLKSKSSLRVKY